MNLLLADDTHACPVGSLKIPLCASSAPMNVPEETRRFFRGPRGTHRDARYYIAESHCPRRNRIRFRMIVFRIFETTSPGPGIKMSQLPDLTCPRCGPRLGESSRATERARPYTNSLTRVDAFSFSLFFSPSLLLSACPFARQGHDKSAASLAIQSRSLACRRLPGRTNQAGTRTLYARSNKDGDGRASRCRVPAKVSAVGPWHRNGKTFTSDARQFFGYSLKLPRRAQRIHKNIPLSSPPEGNAT